MNFGCLRLALKFGGEAGRLRGRISSVGETDSELDVPDDLPAADEKAARVLGVSHQRAHQLVS